MKNNEKSKFAASPAAKY